MEDEDPLEGESAEGGLLAHAARATAFVECLCPEGSRDGLSDPFDEGLAQKRGAGPAPMHPGLVAAAFGDGRDAGVLLKCGGVREALAALTESNEQTRC